MKYLLLEVSVSVERAVKAFQIQDLMSTVHTGWIDLPLLQGDFQRHLDAPFQNPVQFLKETFLRIQFGGIGVLVSMV